VDGKVLHPPVSGGCDNAVGKYITDAFAGRYLF
jgi:hypothetical protein